MYWIWKEWQTKSGLWNGYQFHPKLASSAMFLICTPQPGSVRTEESDVILGQARIGIDSTALLNLTPLETLWLQTIQCSLNHSVTSLGHLAPMVPKFVALPYNREYACPPSCPPREGHYSVAPVPHCLPPHPPPRNLPTLSLCINSHSCTLLHLEEWAQVFF